MWSSWTQENQVEIWTAPFRKEALRLNFWLERKEVCRNPACIDGSSGYSQCSTAVTQKLSRLFWPFKAQLRIQVEGLIPSAVVFEKLHFASSRSLQRAFFPEICITPYNEGFHFTMQGTKKASGVALSEQKGRKINFRFLGWDFAAWLKKGMILTVYLKVSW